MSGTSYSTLSDNTLAALSKKGDEKAFEEITIRYIKLIYSISSDYTLDGYETQDLVQEGLLAFLIACKTYDEKSAASFKNYAVKCAKNRFADILKKQKSKKSVPKSKLVPIETLDEKSSENNVEDYVLEREYLKTMLLHLDSMLSENERRVFRMYANGYSYKEIAAETGNTAKKIDNLIQKIKRKLRPD